MADSWRIMKDAGAYGAVHLCAHTVLPTQDPCGHQAEAEASELIPPQWGFVSEALGRAARQCRHLTSNILL